MASPLTPSPLRRGESKGSIATLSHGEGMARKGRVMVPLATLRQFSKQARSGA